MGERAVHRRVALMRLLDGMPYTPADLTDIRETFRRVSTETEWPWRLEGALEVVRKEQERLNVQAEGV